MAIQATRLDSLPAREAGLICRLSPGIHPDEWGQLCRFLGGLAPGEFDMVATMIHDWKRLIEKALQAIEVERKQQSPPPAAPRPPLFSLGPSGIGGPYQRE